MNKQELLEEAKRRYPIGTEFIACNTNKKCKITTGILKIVGFSWTINEISHNDEPLKTDGFWHCIFDSIDNKWAEIVSKPVEETNIGNT